ncbi:YrrS family protein [Pullulanibacillus sp. KACC 23026]|uniref:YrrS family protein n=1 Tax=Pullulanibacillus sp. KACC 23026 TaxID=3028315 RepID=UPI0023AE6CA9|nr:YrrS family protein [Pullulanibacillus sp. KACC 23026]WEG14105.1 YrrS family protein [Pullulanibacillus sp. KACC 23026]
MAWNDPQMPSRVSRRSSRSKGRLLNLAIGIVIVAIVIVGGILFYSMMHAPANSAESHKASATKRVTSAASSKDGNSGTASSKADSGASKTDSTHKSSTDTTTSADPSDKSTSSNDGETDTTTTSSVYHFYGGGPNGPWEPIGTVQSEPHTTSYDSKSVDWAEQIKALLYATNINDNDYILWRLENGGAANMSKGIISTKEAQNEKYVVMLQWVKDKGWVPKSVTKE